MIEDDINSNQCRFCSSSFSDDILKKIKDDRNDVYCENCGDLIKRVQNKYNFNPTEIIENASNTNTNDTPTKPQKDLESNPDALHYPIGRIFYDKEFPLTFKSNFIIVFSRLTYFHALHLESKGQIDLSGLEVPENAINDLYMSIRHVQNMRIKADFLKNLHEISKEEFERYLKQLQAKIQSNRQYREDFIIYSRWLISKVYLIISMKWNDESLNKFDRIIRDDLKSVDKIKIESSKTSVNMDDFNRNEEPFIIKNNSGPPQVRNLAAPSSVQLLPDGVLKKLHWLELFEAHRDTEKVREVLNREGIEVPRTITLLNYLVKALGKNYFESIVKNKESFLSYSITEMIHWVELYVVHGLAQSHKIFCRESGKNPSPSTFKRRLVSIMGKPEYTNIMKNKVYRISKSEALLMVKLFRELKLPSKVRDRMIELGYRVPNNYRYVSKIIQGFLSTKTYNSILLEGMATFSRSYSKQDAIEFAKIVGIEKTGRPGKFLSDHWISTANKYKWECGVCGISFEKTGKAVIYQRLWCPKCSKYNEENYVLFLFMHLFKKNFEHHKTFSWLKSSKGGHMHFDGYVELKLFGEIINLAFEYDEVQHFQQVLKYHGTYDDFKWGFQLDREKDQLSIDNNIILIRIPYSLHPNNINRFKNDRGMQVRIIETFLSLLEQKYKSDGLSLTEVNNRISRLRDMLYKRSVFTYQDYLNKLQTQSTLDDFYEK